MQFTWEMLMKKGSTHQLYATLAAALNKSGLRDENALALDLASAAQLPATG